MTSKTNYLNVLRTGLTTCFILCVQFVYCQTLQTFTDKKDILIGEQIKLTIKGPLSPANSLAQGIAVPDSIPHFEIVEASKPDTIDNNVLQQTIIITSFDSGRWSFPALPVEFTGAAPQPPVAYTDSFYVNVSYAPADSTNQLRDIKPIIKVSVFDFFWIYVAAGILVLLVVIALLYFYFKKKKRDTPAEPVSKLSPYDEAMEALKNLSRYDLQTPEEIRLYHMQLAALFKNYLGRKQHKNLFNKTTGELLIAVKETGASHETISQLATALRCTDAVKFAKYLPSPDQSDDALQKIKETIQLTERPTNNDQRSTPDAV